MQATGYCLGDATWLQHASVGRPSSDAPSRHRNSLHVSIAAPGPHHKNRSHITNVEVVQAYPVHLAMSFVI
jgi:hypothetical protein